MKFFIIYIVRLYQSLVSPFFPRSCIYNTSCSTFMLLVVKKQGSLLGLFFGIKRILSCNAWATKNKGQRYV